MANIHPYIALNNTKEALVYYEEVLGAKISVVFLSLLNRQKNLVYLKNKQQK